MQFRAVVASRCSPNSVVAIWHLATTWRLKVETQLSIIEAVTYTSRTEEKTGEVLLLLRHIVRYTPSDDRPSSDMIGIRSPMSASSEVNSVQ